jgi:hypothetical protein
MASVMFLAVMSKEQLSLDTPCRQRKKVGIHRALAGPCCREQLSLDTPCWAQRGQLRRQGHNPCMRLWRKGPVAQGRAVHCVGTWRMQGGGRWAAHADTDHEAEAAALRRLTSTLCASSKTTWRVHAGGTTPSSCTVGAQGGPRISHAAPSRQRRQERCSIRPRRGPPAPWARRVTLCPAACLARQGKSRHISPSRTHHGVCPVDVVGQGAARAGVQQVVVR